MVKPRNAKYTVRLSPRQCYVLDNVVSLVRSLHADMKRMSKDRACERFILLASTWLNSTDLTVDYWDALKRDLAAATPTTKQPVS